MPFISVAFADVFAIPDAMPCHATLRHMPRHTTTPTPPTAYHAARRRSPSPSLHSLIYHSPPIILMLLYELALRLMMRADIFASIMLPGAPC